MINLPTLKIRWICLALLVFSFLGCSDLKYRKLESAGIVTSTQLRQSWNNFTVYYRPNIGILYKIKNDGKIQMSGKWIEVAREDMVTDQTVFYLTDVRKILGQDDKLFGYIVYSYRDSAFIKIIDANTVKLIFNYQDKDRR
jgi:hypothetical protein